MTGRLKPYPAMKDSGVPWLGEVPEHWEVRRAKWLFRKMDRPIREQDDVVTCFRDGVVTLRKNRRVRGFTESLKEIGYQGIRRGDLVIHAMDAFAGAVGVADADGKGTPVYSVCKPEPGADAYYYAYTVREMSRSRWIQALAKGIRERSTDFRFEGFGMLPVPIPPLLEQAAIVRFLDHADRRIRRYIRAKQELIKLLDEQKQAIIHRAITRGLDPNVRLKPSGIPWLGDIPDHCAIVPAKQVSDVFVPQRDKPEINPREGTPWITPENVGAKYVALSGLFVSEESAQSTHSRTVPPYSVIASCVGRFGIASINQERVIINQQLQAYVPVEHIDVFFMRYCIQLAKPYFEMEGNATTLAYVNRQAFGNVPVPLPTVDEQERIARLIERDELKVMTAISNAQRGISLVREFRTRLIADVVTGKLDVRDAAARLPDETEEPGPLDEVQVLAEDREDGDGTDPDGVPEEAEA